LTTETNVFINTDETKNKFIQISNWEHAVFLEIVVEKKKETELNNIIIIVVRNKITIGITE